MCSASQPSLRAMPARDAQRHALLAEQRIAAVARADRSRRCSSRGSADEAASGLEIAERVQAAREVVGVAEVLERHLPMRVMIRMLATT